MIIPNHYDPLLTMEALLPEVAQSLGLGEQEQIDRLANELAALPMQRSPLSTMEKLCEAIDQLSENSSLN